MDPDFSVRSLVSHVVDQIEACAPSGPLLLAGYSLGGHVAYWTADTLLTAGRSIPFLGILDTAAMPYANLEFPRIGGPRRIYHRLRTLSAAARRGNAGEVVVRHVAKQLAHRRNKWSHSIAVPLGRLHLPVKLGYHLNNHMRREQQLALIHTWLLQSESSRPQLAAPTVLFRSEDESADHSEDLCWRKRCSNVTLVPVSGTHHTMFDPPHLATLCDRFASIASSAGRRFS
jgi:thioesterase domain-containing protein